jgi:POT family proton-dependent oligopeptide transporter
MENITKIEEMEEEHDASESDPMALSYLLSLFVKVKSGFSSLQGSPPELYKAYLLKFLDSYSYFSLSIIFTLFLSSDFGFSDIQAGTIYGAWGALITIYGLITGVIVDNLGVAKSLRVGFLISLVARLGLFFATSKKVLLFHILVTLPMGNCLGIPVLTTGIRRYTDESSRGFAFGLFYVVMNMAALLSGPVVDMLTIWYKGEEGEEDANGETDFNVWTFSSYRAIILTGIISNIIACCVTLTVREIRVDPNVSSSATATATSVSSFRPTGGTFRQILQETIRAPSFRRFLVVCLITLNVRMIFRHLDATVSVTFSILIAE